MITKRPEAATTDWPQSVKDLVAAGDDLEAECNIKDGMPLGWRALEWAARTGDLEFGWTLLAAGANPDSLGHSHHPIHQAARLGHSKIVQLFLGAGTNVDTRSVNGGTPLHRAALLGHVDCVTTLLKAGADIEARDQDGNSPLHSAASWYQPSVHTVGLLLEAGADPSARNNEGKTPGQLATDPEVKACLNFYEQRQRADEQRQALSARLAQSSSEAPQQQQVRRRL